MPIPCDNNATVINSASDIPNDPEMSENETNNADYDDDNDAIDDDDINENLDNAVESDDENDDEINANESAVAGYRTKSG